MSEPLRLRDQPGGEEALQLPAFLHDPLGVLRRRGLWMLLVTLLGLVATTGLLMSQTPSYVAQATVLITSQKIPEEFVRSTVSESTVANVNAMIGTVLSRGKLSQLIDAYDLYPDSAQTGGRMAAIQRMQDDIVVEPVDVTRDQMRGSTSFIYGFSFEHSDPEKAAQVANAVASSFVEVNLARRTEQAHRTTTFLKEELARDEAALREHTRRLNEFRRDHRGQLPSDLNPHIAKLEALSTRRDSLVTQIATKENRIAQLLSESTETENETLLDDARAELARESAVHTDEHPNVRSLRRRVARLEELVAQERSQGATPSETTTRLTTSEELELRLLKKELASTDDRIAELNQQIEKMPAVGEDAAALEEQVQQLREDYLKSLRKVEDAELAESLEAAEQGAQISVLDRAHAPSKPERTRVKLAVVGVAGALALGIGLGLLLELLDPVVVDAEHLARLSSHPVLGSVPRVG